MSLILVSLVPIFVHVDGVAARPLAYLINVSQAVTPHTILLHGGHWHDTGKRMQNFWMENIPSNP